MKPQKHLLKISRLAEMAGVSVPTVKHYVREGLLPRPVKTSRNMAYYCKTCIDKIRLVKKLQKEKFLPLEVIKSLIDSGESWDEELALGKTLLKTDRFKSGTEPVLRSQVENLIGYALEKIDILEKKGLIHPLLKDGSKVYSPEDVDLISIMKSRDDMGVPVDTSLATLCIYRDAITHAVREDLNFFVRNTMGDIPTRQAIRFITEVDETLDRFIIVYRQKMLKRFSEKTNKTINRLPEDLVARNTLPIAGAELPDLDTIREAAARIAPYAHRTPILTCRSLDAMVGARLSFKCENFQKVGAFKFRGAANAVFSLNPEEARRGVVTHSSGNHAQALALAAQMKGTQAHIVMPENAPAVKVAAVRGYGAEVILCQPTLEAREAGVWEIIRRTGATLIHPYDDVRVIAGQATCALEFIEQVPDLDVLIAPVGGGGLLSGTALSTCFTSPKTRVFGAEPELANDAKRSFQTGTLIPAGPPLTIADGLLTSLGKITFPAILEHVHDIITVREKNIVAAMRNIWERMKIVVEPSGAVPFGAAMEHANLFKNKHVGIILSGGNVDLTSLPWKKNC